MLIQFRARNYASFREEVVLDMRATPLTQHSTHVMKNGKQMLLKTVAIYGPNASGKSNLISALRAFERYVQSHLFSKRDADEQADADQSMRGRAAYRPFLLSDTLNPNTEFEIVFSHNSVHYQYGFSFTDKKVNTEWLWINEQKVFDRTSEQTVSWGKKYKELESLKAIRDDRLYLALLDYFATGKIKQHIDNFKDFFETRFEVFFEVFLESAVKYDLRAFHTSDDKRLEDDAFRTRVVDALRAIDIGITDIRLEEVEFRQKKHSVIKTIHKKYDEHGQEVGTVPFDLDLESAGTLRFMSYIQEIIEMLNCGGVFIVDELSARLHPLLTKTIVDLFQSEANSQGAQLIFTTHDVSLLNRNQFRRDEIVFVDKNERGESELFSLADLRVAREDSSFAKDYFAGKYGAIPIISSLLSPVEDDLPCQD